MTTFTTLIQISANKFDVFKFNAESQSRLYPQTSKVGVAVAIRESTKENDSFIFSLAEKMNNGGL